MSAPQVRMLVNGQASDVLPALDRGLAYGDGLFETIRFVDGVAPLWPRHMQRLSDSCVRLLLPVPDVESLLAEALQVAQGWAQAVVRITVTRGLGERGYALPVVVQPHRVVAGFVAPAWAANIYAQGVRLRVCNIRLAEQPRLAGMKHLNRLEQVLARAEWSDPAVADGLLCDTSGRVVSTTMANLFAVIDGGLVTPSLERCGVAGVARAEVLATHAVRVRDIALDELRHASELFLSSSVRGILPVQAVADTVYVSGPVTRAMQRHWRALGFPMEQA
ncbi:4-amino-4-deoxychorismate lyase [Dyella sp. OK004]|uniref:aminodeoxychorismate lyase n=1 Tax=Dyella sp. OK004 TaxID=1855292 RepID=UPI0008E2016D|nr:aminodeoxychorismate lyase [Dyella sp. OK004]SFS12593.1 4-amino-4-deoxychorismate lyase [Dyella sp. OK004]